MRGCISHVRVMLVLLAASLLSPLAVVADASLPICNASSSVIAVRGDVVNVAVLVWTPPPPDPRASRIAWGNRSPLLDGWNATTLLERLVALEAGEIFGVDGVPLRRVREALGDVSVSSGSLEDRLGLTPGGAEAVTELRTYAERLLLHRSLGSMTDLDAVREVVRTTLERTERRPLVVVDYLQKVYVPKMPVEDERATVVVEGLKDLALDLEVPVLAIVAADKEGLGPGRRVRLHHLRGSSALAYEADIVLMLNDKYEIVAKHHLVYDPANADRYREHVVLSVEKNRSGLDRIDLQLRKRFEQARYETEMVPVDEQLLDDRVFKE